MKEAKKVLAIALILVLSLSIIPLTNVSAAAKVKLNKTKATIYVGKTITLKLKNNKSKVKWSSSNKKVATVTKKGKVKGKKVGKATITAKIGKKKYKCKVTVKNVSVKPIAPINIYNANFDDIVQDVKKNGEFSTYGGYCTYGYVSVAMDGSEIVFFEGHDRKGHSVTIKRGSYIAEARVNLQVGYATAKFDIRYFKGDASDSLNWDNNPSISNAMTYDAAIANVLKNVVNYDFYINGHSLKDIGFTSYLF